ncbi:MAG: hypothetical protein K1X29_07180 [Bdellovibrionales bacterium]|nr:hypothetical protein [Bdellovibrionales bacterium]
MERILSLLFVFIFLLGCVGEKDPYFNPPVISIKSGKLQCLSNIDQTLEDFFSGQLADKKNEEKINQLWNCVDYAISQFMSLVNGQGGKNYSPHELASFLDEHFLNRRGLNNENEFLEELMEVKKLLIGGSSTLISFEDLQLSLKVVFPEIKRIMLMLNPHMEVLHGLLVSNKTALSLNSEKVQRALQGLQKTSEPLALLLERTQSKYSFSHLIHLVKGYESFVKKSNSNYSLAQTQLTLNLLSHVRGLFLGPPLDEIEAKDWNFLFSKFIEVLTWSVQLRMSFSSEQWQEGSGLGTLNQLVGTIFQTLEQGLRLQPEQIFSYTAMEKIVSILEQMHLIPLGLDGSTLNEVMILLGNQTLSVEGSKVGWDEKDILFLQNEVKRWFEIQKFSNEYLNPKLSKNIKSDLESNPIHEMKQLLEGSPWPLRLDEQGRLEFNNNIKNQQYNQKSLTTLNWQRALVRLLLRPYGNSESGDEVTGLSLEQLNRLASDWHKLAEKMGLFDEGMFEQSAKKILIEANLFMPSGQGDGKLDFIEAVQYLATVISGMNMVQTYWPLIQGSCANLGGDTHEEKFLFSCVNKEIFLNKDKILHSMPLLLGFTLEDQKVWLDYFSMARLTTNRDGLTQPVSRGDLVETMVLFHYIENFYARFDANQDQKISVEETLISYPVFKENLNLALGGFLSDTDLLTLYTYLFKYGNLPFNEFGGSVKYLNWKWKRERNEWFYLADRFSVIKILAQLNQSL